MPTWRRHAPAVLYYCVLTVVLAYPLVETMLAGGVPGWEGDNLYYVRSLWWMRRALIDLHILPFVDVTAYYPVGHAIAHSEMTVANTIPAIPITMLLGPERAYDLPCSCFHSSRPDSAHTSGCGTSRDAASPASSRARSSRSCHFDSPTSSATCLRSRRSGCRSRCLRSSVFSTVEPSSRAVWLGLGVAFVALGCW